MGGTLKFASLPASFLEADRAVEELQPRRLNKSAHNGNSQEDKGICSIGKPLSALLA